jgi:replicative DNA helicase
LDPKWLPEVTEVIGPEHFHDCRNETILRHLCRLANAGNPIDAITLHASLKAAGELERAGGLAYIADVAHAVPVAAHATYHAGLVKQAADKRALRTLGTDLIRLAHATENNGQVDLLSEARDLLAAVETAGKPPEPPRFTCLLSSADLAAMQEKPHFLIRGVMVARQPMIMGGRSKVLKTSIAVEGAISLGSGTPFLGRFDTQKTTVGFWSGESGAATIRETALRTAAAKGVNLADCSVYWSFDLPRLSQATDLEALRSTILQRGIKVAIFDPLYLCLLSSDTAGTASNLFAMGSVLQPLSAFAQEAGVTLVLLHHFRKTGQSDDSDPAGLEELAQSGAAEWARQWILLQRRIPYQSDGHHDLWMRCGGSAGHGSLWGLTIDEGILDSETFTGRTWDVEVKSVGDAREQAKRERENRKAEDQEAREEDHRRRVLDALRQFPDGATTRALREAAGLNIDNCGRATRTLLQQGKLTTCKVVNTRGTYDGFRLA